MSRYLKFRRARPQCTLLMCGVAYSCSYVLALRYGWEIKNLPSTCACGAHFNPAHALQCPTGGFTITRHNEVRDLLAESLREVSTNVSVEPTLLPLTGEHLRLRSATTDSDARLDIAASGFYGGRFEQALFDVRVFSPFASSNHGSLPAVYRRQEQEKRRKYGQRVREVEHASFVPLIFSCTGGAGPAATFFYGLWSSGRKLGCCNWLRYPSRRRLQCKEFGLVWNGPNHCWWPHTAGFTWQLQSYPIM